MNKVLWLITDTHLGHKNIIKYCDRPNNFERMILKNWKDTVKADDTVLHLGDVAWGDENLQKLLKLPGRKILLKGNHDKKSSTAYMERGFALVAERINMNLDGMDVLFSHHPIPEHTSDINIHGHLHSLYRADMERLYLPLSLEHMGYRPISVDRDFLRVIRSWVDSGHIPSMQEIIKLRQGYIGHPTEKDFYDHHDDNGRYADGNGEYLAD